MQYRVALDPQLNLSPAEFVEAWNASEQGAPGTAAVGEAPPQSFLSPEMSVALITAAASIPTTVIATFVAEYLKKKYLEKETPKVTVTTVSSPDGQPLLIIKTEEQ